MTDEKIRVMAYSGHRAEEMPKAFFLDDRKIVINEVLEMWIEEGLVDRTRRRFFKVSCNDKFLYEIYLDEKTNEWHRRVR